MLGPQDRAPEHPPLSPKSLQPWGQGQWFGSVKGLSGNPEEKQGKCDNWKQTVRGLVPTTLFPSRGLHHLPSPSNSCGSDAHSVLFPASSLGSPCSFTQHSLLPPRPSLPSLGPWVMLLCQGSVVLPLALPQEYSELAAWLGKLQLSLGRASAVTSPSPRLSCSHVVRFLSPSVVFLRSACVCTACHGFDIVIA